MEWRSQRSQGGNGPVEVIKTKIRDLRHQNAEGSADNSGTTGTSDNNAKPEMQVQTQPKPSSQNQMTPANGTNAGAATASPSTASGTGSQVPAVAKTPAKQTATAQNTQAGSSANSAGSQTTANPPRPTSQPAAEKPKPAASGDNQEVTEKQSAPGAEEMTKARNASDSAAAAAWLWKATAKGNPDAPVQLADLYVKGDGVPRSCEQAVVLLKTAAEKENARARSRLAAMYATGNCVNRSRVEAYRWVSSALAANPNSQWAQQNRDLLWQQMTPDERAVAAKYR
jgi:TPR repeat protein